MQARGHSREDWTTLGAGFITDRDHIREALPRFEHVEDGFSLLMQNINPDFLHGFDDNGVEFTGFKARAVSLELVAADVVQERFGHLAAGAVVDADEENSCLFHGNWSLKIEFVGRGRKRQNVGGRRLGQIEEEEE